MPTRIEKARQALIGAQTKFEEAKRAEWLQLSARLQLEVENAVVEARNNGETIASIGRQYGTKDRATIYRILNNHAQVNEIAGDDVRVEHRGGSEYTLHVGEHWVEFDWDPTNHAAVWFDKKSAHVPADILAELRKSNGRYASLIEE